LCEVELELEVKLSHVK